MISKLLLVYTGLTLHCFAAHAESKADALYAARDVCNLVASFANTWSPDGEISYDQGKFKITRSKSGVTIFEGGTAIIKINDFEYSKYTQCLKDMTK